jgi:hypothetical protein
MPTTRQQLVARLGYGEAWAISTTLRLFWSSSSPNRSKGDYVDEGVEVPKAGRATREARDPVVSRCLPPPIPPGREFLETSALPRKLSRVSSHGQSDANAWAKTAVVCELQLTSCRVACVRGARSRRPALKRVTPTGRPSQAAVTQSLLAMRQRRRVLRRGETRQLRLLTKSTR